jgi:acyl-CoA synthetase (NDP forming)
LSDPTRARLRELIAPGLEPTNPLDLWSTGSGTEDLFTGCMTALADDPSVDVVALSIDLVPEYDGDESYPRAMETLLRRTDKPLVVLSHIGSALDQTQAARLRAQGIPVLEGSYSGARALRHLLDQATPPAAPRAAEIDLARQERWRPRLADGPPDAVTTSELLADYGITVAQVRSVTNVEAAVAAADVVGYPVVLKTDEPGIDHKADVAGVVVGLTDESAVATAYHDLSSRLGPHVVVQAQAKGTVELALGVVRDPLVGPLVLVAVGGIFVELVAERWVVLPPVSRAQADTLLENFALASTLLAGARGDPPADRPAVVDAIVAVGQLAAELGDCLEALDINPLLCGPGGAVAVDGLVVPRAPGDMP